MIPNGVANCKVAHQRGTNQNFSRPTINLGSACSTLQSWPVFNKGKTVIKVDRVVRDGPSELANYYLLSLLFELGGNNLCQ